MALMQHKDQQDDAIIQAARKFLINQQSDFDNKGESDNVFDGGVGYGSRWAHSDLSNAHLAMEALFYAKKTYQSREGEWTDLDWDAAITFVGKCQNLPSTNKEKWVSDHQEDRGGFVYFPGSSMAGERQNKNGSIALRSYGSMSYAGLLSFIYAEMDSQDPRVLAVKEWLTKHYTIKEKSGYGASGPFLLLSYDGQSSYPFGNHDHFRRTRCFEGLAKGTGPASFKFTINRRILDK